MKNNQFDNYSHDELEAQRLVIMIAYLIITIASFLAMTFFVTHNMIGTAKPIWDSVNGLNWGFGQLAYLVISVGFAFGFNAFTYFFYQMDNTGNQRAFVLFVAIAFPMFAEIGQSMTRAEDTRHEAATNSEAFKIMAGRVKNAGVTSDTGISSAMAAAMAEKAKAQTELAACTRYTVEARRQRCERIETGNIAAAQAKAEGFQMAGSASITASSSQLKQDAGMLKELEADNGFLQPIVRLLMSFGIPAIGASFTIAFIIIGSMEVAMAYLGGLLRQLKDRMRALGIAVSSNKIKARYVDGVSYTRDSSPTPLNESAPMTALTNTANAAKQTVSQYATKIEEGLKASPEIIAAEYARANAGNNRLMEDAGNIAGKFGAKIDDALNAANRKDYPQTILYPNAEGKSPEDYSVIKRVDKSPTLSGENTLKYLSPRMSLEQTIKSIQANVKASGATAPAAIRAAVFDAFAGLSSPTPLNDSTLDKIADKLIVKQTHAPAATAPVKQFVGGTGIHNPVLGTAEEHFPLPLSSVATHSPRCLNSVVDNENLTTVTTGDNGDNENQATGEMVEKVAILEQELATQKAEIEAKQRESDNARQRLEANAQANLESEIEARNRAAAARELEIRQRAATELDNARQRAEEAAATAARELAAAQALATEKEERGALTDEQIHLATSVIRTAITEGHIEKVGTPQVSPILKAAGLPTGAPVQRVLHKLACKQLEAEGLVIQNPNKANGQPLYLIA
jgi:hypothetical protein